MYFVCMCVWFCYVCVRCSNWLRDNFPAGQGWVQEAPTGKKGKKGAGGRICSLVSTSSPYKLGPIVYIPTRNYIIWDRLHEPPVRRLLSQRVLKLSAQKTRWECRFFVHPQGLYVLPPTRPSVCPTRKSRSLYRHKCLINHQITYI